MERLGDKPVSERGRHNFTEEHHTHTAQVVLSSCLCLGDSLQGVEKRADGIEALGNDVAGAKRTGMGAVKGQEPPQEVRGKIVFQWDSGVIFS